MRRNAVRLTGFIEVLGFDQVEGCIVIQLFFGQSDHLVWRVKVSCFWYRPSRRPPAAALGAPPAEESSGVAAGGNAGSYTSIKILVTLQAFCFSWFIIDLQNSMAPCCCDN